MIARIWRGFTDAAKADEYLDYLRLTGLKDYRETAGNRGVLALRRVHGDRCEFVLISLWDSMDAVHAFSGTSADEAKYYPEDVRFLLEMEPHVRHYEVADGIGDLVAMLGAGFGARPL
jgi:heme-degrading monooxygenase HmoA